MPKLGDVNTCLHCRRNITFSKYWGEKKEPVKKWVHPEGIQTCLTKPENWKGRWPVATPACDR